MTNREKKENLGKIERDASDGTPAVLCIPYGCSLLDIKDGGLGMTNPDYVEPEKDEIDEENSEKAQYEKDPYEKYRFEKNQHEKNPDEEDQVASWLSETGGQALAEEQESLRDYGAVLGAAFLGYTADYSFPGKTETERRDVSVSGGNSGRADYRIRGRRVVCDSSGSCGLEYFCGSLQLE